MSAAEKSGLTADIRSWTAFDPTTDSDGIGQERQVANNGQHPLAGHRPRSSLLLDDLGPPTGWMAWENALAFLTGVVMLSE